MKKILSVIIFISMVLLFSHCNQTPSQSEPETIEEATFHPTLAYGIPIDSMLVFSDKVKRNQYLSEILLAFNVDYQTIDLLAKRSKSTFDVRKIRAGNRYSIMCTNDSLQKVQYFVYDITPTDYVVFDLRDSVHIHLGEKEIEVREKSTSGAINSSLWNALVDSKADPNLANELSEIYAWTIDFFGIQKGDAYKIIFEELYVEDEYIGIGKVHAASFTHIDQNYYSFYFVQDSTGDYFDEQANSMRRTFLKAPLRFRRISSRFSYSRYHPILKRRMPHTGIDYAANYGTPVHSVGDGVVTFAAYKGANGNLVKVKHNGTYSTAYLHLSKFGKGIKSGKHVKQGDIIGYVGSTGRSTGPHLDFRFYRNGKPIDPLKVESPPAEPVDSANLYDYQQLVKQYKQRLDSLKINYKPSLAEVK